MQVFRQSSGHVTRALTIAGSDSGGGAGIQADLKTMHQFGVYGLSVATALTAQNTLGVQSIFDVPAEFVRAQLTSVQEDIGMDAVKAGMLSSTQIMHEVADFLAEKVTAPLVVDPVMVAKGGAALLQPDAVDVLKHRLLPLATITTPNLPEAEVICGYPIRGWEDCHRAARDIALLGPNWVVIKGGHSPSGEVNTNHDAASKFLNTDLFATDVVYVAETDAFTYLVTPRIDSQKTHGTGCTYSATITSLLACGVGPITAIASAKAFVHEAIYRARDWDVGRGHGPTDHSAPTPRAYAPRIGKFNIYQNNGWTVV